MKKSTSADWRLDNRYSSDDTGICERTPGENSLDHSSMNVHESSFCRLRGLQFLFSLESMT